MQRYFSGEIDADTVEAWANLIECREDIEFEPSHNEIVLNAIFNLANPLLQGRLEDIAPALLTTLR